MAYDDGAETIGKGMQVLVRLAFTEEGFQLCHSFDCCFPFPVLLLRSCFVLCRTSIRSIGVC